MFPYIDDHLTLLAEKHMDAIKSLHRLEQAYDKDPRRWMVDELANHKIAVVQTKINLDLATTAYLVNEMHLLTQNLQLVIERGQS
jgi:hypothetical protein